MKKIYISICALIVLLAAYAEAESVINDIRISRNFFNPSIGEKIEIEFEAATKGSLTIQLLDRDGYVTRQLATSKAIDAGKQKLIWDGRNDKGEIVPDEAYSLKIDFRSADGAFTYFPADKRLKEVKAELGYYDRHNKVLNYTLPKPARIHAHAGSATIDPKTKTPIGPVLKTLVNREPRVAGSVIEHWSGFDESGTIYVPELPNFVISISASELPENSIITIGNQSESFLETLKTRNGNSLFRTSGSDHSHHLDLSTDRDISPALKLIPLNAVWSAEERVWIVKNRLLKLKVQLEGPSAEHFSKLPAGLGIFVNDQEVWKTSRPNSSFLVDIPISQTLQGIHYVAVNWTSKFGPLVVNAMRIKIPEKEKVQDLKNGSVSRNN